MPLSDKEKSRGNQNEMVADNTGVGDFGHDFAEAEGHKA
jgi:hypothetical protein